MGSSGFAGEGSGAEDGLASSLRWRRSAMEIEGHSEEKPDARAGRARRAPSRGRPWMVPGEARWPAPGRPAGLRLPGVAPAPTRPLAPGGLACSPGCPTTPARRRAVLPTCEAVCARPAPPPPREALRARCRSPTGCRRGRPRCGWQSAHDRRAGPVRCGEGCRACRRHRHRAPRGRRTGQRLPQPASLRSADAPPARRDAPARPRLAPRSRSRHCGAGHRCRRTRRAGASCSRSPG